MRVIRKDFEKFSKTLNSWNVNKYHFAGEPKEISARLLLFKYREKIGSNWSLDLPRYHIIHKPTGLVIADVEYSEVSNVKKSFESCKWTLQGKNTLALYDAPFTFTMTCYIEYEIES